MKFFLFILLFVLFISLVCAVNINNDDVSVEGNLLTDGYIKIGTMNPVITENRLMAVGSVVTHSGFSGKNTGWTPYFKMYETSSPVIKTGTNGEFTDLTNIFCDYTADNFTSTDSTRPTKVLTLLSGTYLGGIAEVNTYINSSCISLEKNPGWNADLTSLSWSLKTGLKINFNDGGAYKFVIGSNEESYFKFGAPNATGEQAVLIYDIAGADDHTSLTIDNDFAGFDGTSAMSILSTTSAPADNIHRDALRLIGDASNVTNSELHFIQLDAIGLGSGNDVDALHVTPLVSHIIHMGSADTIYSGYVESVNTTANFTSPTDNSEFFTNDNDYIYIGSTGNFTNIGFDLLTYANANADTEYYYCNSSGWFTLTGLSDSTNGMQNSGSVSFNNPSDRGVCNEEYDGTPFSDTTNYSYIALKRTRNNLLTNPVESYISISGSSTYFSLAKDYMNLNPVDTAPITCDATHLGAIYFDISEDGMCQCASGGWELIKDGSACT